MLDWKATKRQDYSMCQRLPNGHYCVVSNQDAVEINADGQAITGITFDENLRLCDAWQLPLAILFAVAIGG